MGEYAQTHLQLYRQMHDAGYSDGDVVLVDRAYRVAMRIFAGHYRPNNKPFLVHLVGVASILVRARQTAGVVAAGLLHSSYLEFGKKKKRSARPRGSQIAEVVSPQVQELIAAYAKRNWSVQDFSELEKNAKSLSAEHRQLFAIKIADIHEEFLDRGTLFQPGKKILRDQDSDKLWLQKVATGISALGYEPWAQEFARDVDENSGTIPDALRGTASSSYFQPPGLLPQRHLKNRLIRWLARI